MRTASLLLVAAAGAVLLAGCGGQSGSASGSSGSSSASASTSTGSGSASGGTCTYTRAGTAARRVDLPPRTPSSASSLTITTNRGPIAVRLDAKAAPCTTSSFTSLAKQGYFDGTRCHRLTTQGIFVLQCGDPTATGTGGPGYQFPDELTGKERYPAGTLAMANSGPDTNGSQFFLVYADTTLPPSYTVFGSFGPAGRRVVTSIARAGTADGGSDGAPKDPVVIRSVK